jgi:hypothetical protein
MEELKCTICNLDLIEIGVGPPGSAGRHLHCPVHGSRGVSQDKAPPPPPSDYASDTVGGKTLSRSIVRMGVDPPSSTRLDSDTRGMVGAREEGDILVRLGRLEAAIKFLAASQGGMSFEKVTDILEGEPNL